MKKAEVFPHLGFSFAYKKAQTGSDRGCKILLCVCYALKPQLILYTTISLASCQQNNSKK
uniref:Uncharacterized protein n=1 Tax=Phage sp. ct17O1 TaxID=2825789 RepID=A0A8S5PMG1_9VIRU|nr:MAG TPA: hypothetical protein [Phage sp. ct17O1]